MPSSDMAQEDSDEFFNPDKFFNPDDFSNQLD